MSQSAVPAFDSTIHLTNIWLHELGDRLGWTESRRSYHALRAVLHTLRDRLSVDEAAAFAAQLPLLVRGLFFEGWHPHDKPLKERKAQQFLAHVRAAFPGDWEVDPEYVTRCVLHVIAKHVSGGEIESMKRGLPKEIRELWPQ